jgi:putative tryptophan/tyrosine transport system substrate-binding protein
VRWRVRGERWLEAVPSAPIRRSVAALVLGPAVLALVGVLPSPVGAQRTRPPYRVGVLNDARAANHPTVEGLKAGLRDLGFEEGRDVIFDVKLTDGNPERMPAAAGALVKAGVDVIFTSNEAATLAAKAATQTIPIVFTLVGDPVAAGIVKSLAHPVGNLTGVSSLTTELVPKRLETLKTLAPGLRRVWAIYHGADPASGAAITRALENSSRFGIEILPRAVLTQDELEQILERLRPGDAMLVPDTATMGISAVLLETSLARRIPAAFSSELWVSHGGLVSYGADYRAQGVQAARLVGKILHNARPQDLPVEGADRIVLALNLKTAAAFGLTAPRTLLFRADIIRR